MNPEITSLEYDSRRVRSQSLFFAVKGENVDGHDFLESALARGAAAVVSERPAPEGFPAPWLRTSEIRAYMAEMADQFYGHPSREIALIGVTGTNGKTTTAFVVHSIQRRLGPALLMGTVKTAVGELETDSERTTPEAIDIQRTLAEAVRAGCRNGALEVSSHALAYRRVHECRFPVAVFTNLSQDHLDFHGTMEDYFQAKRLLFQRSCNPAIRHAVVNADDPYGRRVDPSPRVETTFFGFAADSHVRPLEVRHTVDGTRARLSFFGRELELSSGLVGRHNLYNLMAAAAACSLAGQSDLEIAAGVAELKAVPGRFERVEADAPFAVFVDYAHTPDALANALALARTVCRGRVICVFGCGGDRDRAKRRRMGEVATELADLTLITTDNPRSEAPEAIIEEIVAGVSVESAGRWEKVVDRREAIGRAISLARPGDLVLLAGKGHETYQEIEGRKIHFDDREVAREAI